MVRRSGLLVIFLVGVICFLLIVFSQKENYDNNTHYKIGIGLQEIGFDEVFKEDDDFPSIDDIVNEYRLMIRREISNYKFPPGTTVDNFTLSTGGRPRRSIIITTWRSGSTFLGDILNAVPGNYYHYEPLLDYGIIQVRGPPHAESAIRNLKNLLNCDYSDLLHYLTYAKTHTYLFSHNTRLWKMRNEFDCFNSTILSRICREFPFQSMKSVRLRLKLAEELLDDPKLNVKVLLLVRDPRGTLQSRKHRFWCLKEPDCDNPDQLCGDLVSDYSAAIRLQKLYPKRFRALRYEDLSLDPYNYAQDLFKFYGLDFVSEVKNFLDTHTVKNIGGVSSTFRDSKSAPFHWRMDLNYSEVQYIEENCIEAMKLWGYNKVPSEEHLHDFNPLTNYTIK